MKINKLTLKRNLGHQRAITIGLSYIGEHYTADMVVVMDSDGEDRPEDAIQLIDYCIQTDKMQIIFARRSQRSESRLFRFFYYLYRHLYQSLTGYDIQVGNFSLIPFQFLARLSVVSEIWTHYASGILKSGLPTTAIPTRRGTRYHGKSKMNFTDLVTHGLGSISVHGEKVGVRLLMASLVIIMVTLIMICLVIGVRLTTPFAIPGWASSLVLVLFAVMLQAFIISLSFIFLVLIGRNNTSFIPVRDYHYFVLSVEEII
jgi:glycosyltransferase involved in cell wall biosynthesis